MRLTFRIAWLALAVIALATAARLYRYERFTVGGQTLALDRWSHRVCMVTARGVVCAPPDNDSAAVPVGQYRPDNPFAPATPGGRSPAP